MIEGERERERGGEREACGSTAAASLKGGGRRGRLLPVT